MFGYVRPSDGHLTAEDKQRFQAAYCGLCRSLGRRYGLRNQVWSPYPSSQKS